MSISRFKNWLRNLPNRSTARAYRALCRSLANDSDYANSWQANIAIPILDRFSDRIDLEEANEIADILMKHLFGTEKTFPLQIDDEVWIMRYNEPVEGIVYSILINEYSEREYLIWPSKNILSATQDRCENVKIEKVFRTKDELIDSLKTP